jgi:hypothetical protein
MISFELAKELKRAGFPPSEVARAYRQAGYRYVSMPALSALLRGTQKVLVLWVGSPI